MIRAFLGTVKRGDLDVATGRDAKPVYAPAAGIAELNTAVSSNCNPLTKL
jgi:hypothetical protein